MQKLGLGTHSAIAKLVTSFIKIQEHAENTPVTEERRRIFILDTVRTHGNMLFLD